MKSNSNTTRRRRVRQARQGVLAAVIALAMGSGVVIAEQGSPEVDAAAVLQTVDSVSEWLADSVIDS